MESECDRVVVTQNGGLVDAEDKVGDIVVDEHFTVFQQNEAYVFLLEVHLFTDCYAHNRLLL